MMMNKLLAVVAVSSMVAAPVLAAPAVNPAAPLSIGKAAGAKPASARKKSSGLAGAALALVVIAGAAGAAGIIAAADGGSSSN